MKNLIPLICFILGLIIGCGQNQSYTEGQDNHHTIMGHENLMLKVYNWTNQQNIRNIEVDKKLDELLKVARKF